MEDFNLKNWLLDQKTMGMPNWVLTVGAALLIGLPLMGGLDLTKGETYKRKY